MRCDAMRPAVEERKEAEGGKARIEDIPPPAASPKQCLPTHPPTCLHTYHDHMPRPRHQQTHNTTQNITTTANETDGAIYKPYHIISYHTISNFPDASFALRQTTNKN